MASGENSGWVEASGKGRWACSARVCAAVWLETPNALTLPAAWQRLEGAGDLGGVGQAVRPVDLPQVDPLDAEPPQRGVAGLGDVGRARIIRHAHADAALGGEREALAQARRLGQHPAQQRLGRAEALAVVGAVDVGGVQKVDAGLERRLHALAGGLHVRAPEAPHAPGERGDLDPALAERDAGVGWRGAAHRAAEGWGRTMADILRIGVIGAGMMGREHIRNLKLIPEALVTALADPHAPSLAAAQAELGRAVETFETAEAMLAERGVDAVLIVSPNHTHRAVLEPAFATGVHILCEKPLCATVADSRWAAERAARSPAVFWTGMEYRFMPPAARLIDQVRAGAVGRLRMVSIREHRFPFLEKVADWNRFSANTGGTMVEKCCHFFDLMRLLIGAEPVRVFCSGAMDVNHLDERYEGRRPDIIDNSFTTVEFENGARAMLDLCMFAEGSAEQEHIAVVGDHAKIETWIPSGRLDRSPRTPYGTPKAVVSEVVAVDPAVLAAGTHHGSTYYELRHFVDACLGRGPVQVTAEDGLRAVAIGAAAELSAHHKRVVAMAELGF